jgi:hypothetical protein
MVCVLVGFVISSISRNAPELYKCGIGYVIEFGTLIILLLFCEGSFSRNFLCYFFGAALSQMIMSMFFYRFAPNALAIWTQREYRYTPIGDILLVNVVYAVLLILLKPVVCKVVADTRGRRPIYRILVAAVFIQSWLELDLRSQPNEMEDRILFRSLFVILASVLVVLMVVVTYRKARQLEKQQMEKEQEILSEAYETLWHDNQNLHFAKHEIMRYMRRLRSMDYGVADREHLEYVQQMKEEIGSAFMIPCTGNIYVDAFMVKQYKAAESMEIPLELVLEPLPETFDREKQMVTVLSELFDYAMEKRRKEQYMRLSLRRRSGRYLISMEAGISEGEYYKRRLLDQLGDKLLFRQSFRQSRYIAANDDGGILYRLEPKNFRIMIML